MSATTPLPDDLDGVSALLQQVDQQLAELGHSERAQEHTEAMTQLRNRFEERFDALTGARTAAASLRKLTSPGELLLQAPAALCTGTAFQRAILSAIRESELQPLAARFADDPDAGRRALEQLHADPVRLEHQLLETDVLRRRRAMLVHNAAVNPRVSPTLSAVLGADAYVAAPLLSGTRVVGIVHASLPQDVTLDALDRDVLWEFTSLLSRIHESAELHRTLRSERDQLSRFLEWLNARSVSLAQAPVTFAAYADQPEQPHHEALAPAEEWTPASAQPRDDRLVFEGLLTRRELEVLRLLAEGGTNHTIADALVVSDATIKFHTRSILRKLHVSNRAEAVARYLALVSPPR